ncbi:MAG TPA: hypothetical protein V6C76_10275 [Drouetiella sp.]
MRSVGNSKVKRLLGVALAVPVLLANSVVAYAQSDSASAHVESVKSDAEIPAFGKEKAEPIVTPPSPLPPPSPPPVTTTAVNRVTARAIDKELELMQMSTNLKIQTAPLNQWRERRWFAYTFQNQVLTVIGVLMNGCTRFEYKKRTAAAPKNIFVNASWVRLVAYAINLAGCAGETANDLRIQLREKKMGIDMKSYLRHSKESLAAIDELIRQRAALIDTEQNSENREMLIREGVILSRIRNCCADDLEDAYLRAKSTRASRYFQYGYVGASNIVGGAGTLANTIFTMENKPPNFLWPGGVTDTTTGFMNAFSPQAVRAAGRHAAKNAGHPLTNDLSFNAEHAIVDKFDADLQKFCALPACESNSEISGHVPMYKLQGEILAQHFSMRPVAPKGTVGPVLGDVGAFSGGVTKSANGILTLVGAYKYLEHPERRFRSYGAGGITYGAGMSFAAEETLRREAVSEYHWFKKPKEKRLEPTLKAQLAALDQARENLRGSLAQ